MRGNNKNEGRMMMADKHQSTSDIFLREAVQRRSFYNSRVRASRESLSKMPSMTEALEEAQAARAMIEEIYRIRDQIAERHALACGQRDLAFQELDREIDQFNEELDRVFRPTLRALKRLEEEHGRMVFPRVRVQSTRQMHFRPMAHSA
jgi:hypothetical protein